MPTATPRDLPTSWGRFLWERWKDQGLTIACFLSLVPNFLPQ